MLAQAAGQQSSGEGSAYCDAPRRRGPPLERPRIQRLPRRFQTLVALRSATLLALLTADALLRAPGRFDYRMTDAARQVKFGGLESVMAVASELTGALWGITLWAALLTYLVVVARAWLPALITVVIPIGGGVTWVLRSLVDRPRPDGDLLYPLSENLDVAFPSAYVVGVVLLWGYIAFLAGRITRPVFRYLVWVAAVALIFASGISRVWLGTHLVTDVAGGYALGLLLLIALLWIHRRIEAAVGDIPFIHAAPVPHDESQPHAHALTSTILFEPERVIKVYAPGFVPRALYWLAFQAEFPYLRNQAALRAAVHRRNLAGMLTEYWYGENRVARALGVEQVGERYGLASERIAAVDEPDAVAAQDFLYDLADRFDAAGLPTWQIDPRQPRGKDNVLQTEDGRFYIVDLESGLISLLASPRAWLRGIRRADVPLFDTVYFDITRDYIEREAPAMQAAMGADWYAALVELLGSAEAANREWHASEPRVWARGLGWLLSGCGIPAAVRRLRRASAGGRERAEGWIGTTTDTWERDRRITPAQATGVRDALATPHVKRVLPHFGVHLAIGVATRFPVGSILRAGYVALNMLITFVALLTRRIDREEWRLRRSIHSPLVMLVAGMPGIGTFAYLLSGPMRANQLLIRMVLDNVLLKVPGDIYERFGWRSLIAYRAQPADAAGQASEPGTALFARRPRLIAFWVGAGAVALIALDVLTQTLDWLTGFGGSWWAATVRLFDADTQGSLVTWYSTLLLGSSALLALAIAATLRRRRMPGVAFWDALGLLALVLAFEEHNPRRLTAITLARDAARGELGMPRWAGIALALAAGTLAVLLGVRFLRSMPLEIRGLLILGLGLFAGGALGLETAGWLYRHVLDGESILYQTIVSVEELVELAGVVVVLYAILEYAARIFGGAASRPAQPVATPAGALT